MLPPSVTKRPADWGVLLHRNAQQHGRSDGPHERPQSRAGGEFLKARKLEEAVKSNRFLKLYKAMSRLPHGCNVMRDHQNRLVLVVAKSVKKFEKRIA